MTGRAIYASRSPYWSWWVSLIKEGPKAMAALRRFLEVWGSGFEAFSYPRSAENFYLVRYPPRRRHTSSFWRSEFYPAPRISDPSNLSSCWKPLIYGVEDAGESWYQFSQSWTVEVRCPRITAPQARRRLRRSLLYQIQLSQRKRPSSDGLSAPFEIRISGM